MGRQGSFLLFLFVFGVIKCPGQTDSSSVIYSVSGKFGYSSIWTERESLQQFVREHPWSVQLDLGILKNTQQAWNYCNCYSENGLSLGYINFGDPEKLSKAITLAGYIEPHLVTRKLFQLSIRATGGLAFLDKVFDHSANPDAIFFSAKTSFILGLSVNASWHVTKNWKLITGVQFNHISNGGRKEPNEGMNLPGANFGLSYTINPQPLQLKPRESFTSKTISLVAHGFGNAQVAWASNQGPEEERIVIGTNIGVIKRLGRIIGVGAGGEYYYSPINEILQQRSGHTIQNSVGAVNIQSYLFLGKILLGPQLAWYVTPNTGFDISIYQRYFFEYEVKRNWYAGVTLKAHGYLSDYIAFSTGYFLRLYILTSCVLCAIPIYVNLHL